MNWEFTTAQKIRTAASLIVVFLLILATNLIDSHHLTIVKNSLTTVYDDRLMAKSYLYHISRQMQIKRNILEDEDDTGEVRINANANDSIRTLIDKFSTTSLTEKEARHFASLQDRINRLLSYEQSLAQGEEIVDELPSIDAVDSYYAGIFEDLDALSNIQIEEGRREVFLSTQSIDTSNLIAKIEIGVLILIGVLLQLLIFLKPFK